eukprot:364764-Chlamydomonas_euryale.AAC.4
MMFLSTRFAVLPELPHDRVAGSEAQSAVQVACRSIDLSVPQWPSLSMCVTPVSLIPLLACANSCSHPARKSQGAGFWIPILWLGYHPRIMILCDHHHIITSSRV